MEIRKSQRVCTVGRTEDLYDTSNDKAAITVAASGAYKQYGHQPDTYGNQHLSFGKNNELGAYEPALVLFNQEHPVRAQLEDEGRANEIYIKLAHILFKQTCEAKL